MKSICVLSAAGCWESVNTTNDKYGNRHARSQKVWILKVTCLKSSLCREALILTLAGIQFYNIHIWRILGIYTANHESQVTAAALCPNKSEISLKTHRGGSWHINWSYFQLSERKINVSYLAVWGFEVESPGRSCIKIILKKNITSHWYLFSKWIQ